MKRVSWSAPLMVCILLSVSVSLAQQAAQTETGIIVPRLIRFGGVLRDSSKQALGGVVGITFALYRDQEGGAALWSETQNVALQSNGRYDVLLGATHSDGVPMDLFTSGEARWLGVQLQGQAEQPRVILLSVPYALKAADAETVGGLPASAFVLAAPTTSGTSAASPSAALQPLVTGSTPVTTAGGTVNKLAKFDAGADITNSQIFDNGTNVGIGNAVPAAKLDVSGTGIFRGSLSLSATGTATSTAGKNSQPLNFTASAFNSSTLKALNQTFRWQAESVGNNTTTPLGKLNLLFGSGTTAPVETGLSISNKGLISFAVGQTFPGGSGSGTVTSVGLNAPASDFAVSGSPVTGAGTLGLAWSVVPTSAKTSNAIVKRDASGNFSANIITGTFSGNGAGLTNVNAALFGGFAPGAYVRLAASNHFTNTMLIDDGFPQFFSSNLLLHVNGDPNNSVDPAFFENGTVSIGAANPLPIQVSPSLYVDNINQLEQFHHTAVFNNNGSGNAINATLKGTSVFRVDGSGAVHVTGNGAEAIIGDPNCGAGSTTVAIGFLTNTGLDCKNNFNLGANTTLKALFINRPTGGTIHFVEGNGSDQMTINSGGLVTISSLDVTVGLTKPLGSFKIDHPLDPANKYLYHSFVESPDMMNVYDGNVTTDKHGIAIVVLPDYFEALNRDFRYQLTVIGQFAQAIIAKEIEHNRFSIKTNKPSVKVSWQVTGIRHDAVANAHRIQVEVDKSPEDRGHYLHPELFGAPPEQAIGRTPHVPPAGDARATP